MFVILIGIFIPIFDFDQFQLAFKLGLETTKKMNEICLKLILWTDFTNCSHVFNCDF